MTRLLTVTETANWLKNRNGFLILVHRRPDGDTVGCAGALAQGLREYGKTAYVLNNPEITPRYRRFVKDYFAPAGYDPEYIITIDTASQTLLPVTGEKYKDNVSLCIDHHPSNTLYAEYTSLDGSLASCGELVYQILMALAGSISVITAGALYAALLTDTGCFVYGNTTANTLRVASLLVEAGAPQKELNKTLFRTMSRNRIKIEGAIYSGLEFYFDGTVVIATITRKMMDKAEAMEDDVDDIASIPGSVEGALVGITIREMSGPLDCKVSVRTGFDVNSHDLCARFGGGGHPMAAGFTLKASVAEIKRLLLEALPEYLPAADNPQNSELRA